MAAATFVDSEDEHERYAVPELIRQEYLENRRRHFDRVRSECLATEIEIQEFFSDQPLDLALQAFLKCRRRALLRSSRVVHAENRSAAR